MSSEYMIESTDDSFESELSTDKPLFVKFTADWCGPCKSIQPMLDDLAQEYLEKVKFISINIDNASKIAQKYSIRGIPTMLFFKDGQVVKTIVGTHPKAEIQLALDNLLA